MQDKKGTILVVDDNKMNRLKLSMYLEKENYLVELAEDGNQALEMLRQNPVDIVLLDLVMPEMDGFAVLEILKADSSLRKIPVIVISSLDDLDGIARCIEMGAEDYLPKNFDPVLLNARLNSTLQKKKLQDLERRYMQQELMLHQNEKLALLGKVSAGMAHELNNPSAAVQRGANLLHKNFEQLQARYLALGKLQLNNGQIEALMTLNNLARDKTSRSIHLDMIIRSDLEEEMENYLLEKGVEDAWDIAATLVELGFKNEELDMLAQTVNPENFTLAIEWLCASATIYTLAAEIDEGALRMSEIVKALKNYTYMDQAPIQNVNIHDGIESTLVILRSKLAAGVSVERDYADDLPLIEAYGSELNQVWTNIIDNAIDAMEGEGKIVLRTRYEKPWVIVEIEDNGPGIPKEIQEHIFDLFFTTKKPGKGTGLGLNISHNIIVEKHHGDLTVSSEPGKTCFEISLPTSLDVIEMKKAVI